jgi:hypothetical protein
MRNEAPPVYVSQSASWLRLGIPSIALRTSDIAPWRTPTADVVTVEKFEGFVTELGQDSFFARLVSRKGEAPDQEVEIGMDQVSAEDRSKMSLGALFDVSIGHDDLPDGGRRRISFLAFRQSEAWSPAEIESAKREANNLRQSINRGPGEPSTY